MYNIFIKNDKELELIDSNIRDSKVINPVLVKELNSSGNLKFEIQRDNHLYDKLFEFRTEVYVYKEKEQYFKGRIEDIKEDIDGKKEVYARGILGYLDDSVQPSKEYHDFTVYNYLNDVIRIHNEQVENKKKFKLGEVTVESNLYRIHDYQPTLNLIMDRLPKRLGGYIYVYENGGENLIDYVQDFDITSVQKIEFGVNLLDFEKSIIKDELATVLIPLGKDEENNRITIKSVNGGKDYIENQDGITRYGRIVKTLEFENVKEPINLLNKGKEELNKMAQVPLSLGLSAIDLHYTDININDLKVGMYVPCVSRMHNLDKKFLLRKIELHLHDPAQDKIVLGDKVQNLTERTNNSLSHVENEIVKVEESAYAEARKVAKNVMNQLTEGHVAVLKDEILISDKKDYMKAQKIWRMNLNGFAYSENGYKGPFDIAITMDGKIMAEFIYALKISAEMLEADALTSKNYVKNSIGSFLNLADGSFDSPYLKWDKYGKFKATDGEFTGKIIATSGSFTGSISASTISGATISASTISGTTIVGASISGGNVKGAIITSHADASGQLTLDGNSIVGSGGSSILFGSTLHIKGNQCAVHCPLVVMGTVTGTSWVQASDQRLKREIEEVEDGALEKINQLKVVEYKLKDTNKHIPFGFIAQDVQKVDEDIVSNVLFGKKTFLGIEYNVIVSLNTKGIQELSKESAQLKEKNIQLNNKLNDLESRILNIEKLMKGEINAE